MEYLNKQLYLHQYAEVIDAAFKSGKTVRIKIIGSSMSPALKENESVVLQKPDKLSKADIILYKIDETEFCLHRIIKSGEVLRTLGDNNIVAESVRPENVIAKVQSIEKTNKIIKRRSLMYYGYFCYSRIRRLYRRVRNKVKNEKS